MSTTDLRDLLDADREVLADVVEWLAAMPQKNFEQQVNLDIRARLDPVASQALRHPKNLLRWNDILTGMARNAHSQLNDPERKTPEYGDWRRRALNFQQAVLGRRAEAKNLLRHQQISATVKRANGADRREPGERATQRLVEAHRVEFLTLLAEELEQDGLELSDRKRAELERLTAEDGDA